MSCDVLNALEVLYIVLRDQTNCSPCPPCSCCSSHSVDIVLWVGRHIVIQNQSQVRNIKTTAGHISADNDGAGASFEGIQSSESLILGHLPIDGYSRVVQISEKKSQTKRSSTSRHEYDCLGGSKVRLAEQESKVGVLEASRNEDVVLSQRGHSRVLGGGDLDFNWTLKGSTL